MSPSTSKSPAFTCHVRNLVPAANLRAVASPSTLSPTSSSLTHNPLFNYTTSRAGAHHQQPSPKMTYQLPPMLLNLFAPRPPLRWVEPIDHAPEKRCTPKISGVGQYLQAMREYKDNDGYVPSDSWLQTRDRKKLEKKEKQERLLTDVDSLCTSLTNFHSHPYFSITPAHTSQTSPPMTPRYRATLSRHSLFRGWRTASPRTTSSANSAATVPSSASGSSRTSLRRPTRRPRSESAATRSSFTSARKT